MTQDKIYVFSPDEPGLRIMINGKMQRFSNGRLTLDADDPAVAHFQKDIEETLPGNTPKFIITDDLEHPALIRLLGDRVGRTMARRANAQDPPTIQQDTEIQLNVMLSRSGQSEVPAMSQADLIRLLAVSTANRLAPRPELAVAPTAEPGINSSDLIADRQRDDAVIEAALRRAGGAESLDGLSAEGTNIPTPEPKTTESGEPFKAEGEQDPGDPNVFGVVSN